MEYYKQLNKELVKINQQMKVDIALYRIEVASLHQQLMDAHATRVEREIKLKNFVVQNLKNTIFAIDPDLKTNGGEEDDDDELHKNPQRRVSTAQILQELRHSNSMQRRRSSIVVSPRSLSSSRMSISGVDATLEEQQADENSQKEKNLKNEENAEKEQETVVQSPQLPLDCIEETETELSDTDSESQVIEVFGDSISDFTSKEPQDQSHATESPESPPIRMLRRQNICPRQHRTPLQDVSNLNDSSTITNSQKTSPSTRSVSDLSNIDSIGPVRRNPGIDILLNDEPLSLPDKTRKDRTLLESCEKVDYSNDIGITSVALSELSIRQIADAPSSTPNHTLQRNEMEGTPSLSSTIRPRSQRSCKPINLTEQSLNKKLRNEETTKTNNIKGRKKKK